MRQHHATLIETDLHQHQHQHYYHAWLVETNLHQHQHQHHAWLVETDLHQPQHHAIGWLKLKVGPTDWIMDLSISISTSIILSWLKLKLGPDDWMMDTSISIMLGWLKLKLAYLMLEVSVCMLVLVPFSICLRFCLSITTKISTNSETAMLSPQDDPCTHSVHQQLGSLLYTVHCPQKASVPSDCVYTHHYHHHYYYYNYVYYYCYTYNHCTHVSSIQLPGWTVVYQTDLGSVQLQPTSWAFNCQSKSWLQW